jgi:hypothetical protein
MRIVLLITVIESAMIALFLIWRYRTSRVAALAPIGPVASGTRSTSPAAKIDANSRWSFINGWKVEPQSDDRIPAFGRVAPATSFAPAHRSTARRRHQAMYKQWSQDRHD